MLKRKYSIKSHKSGVYLWSKKKVIAQESNFDDRPSEACYDETIALSSDKISVDLQNLDLQIKSMITKTDFPAGERTRAGKMASCNVCGKQGPMSGMPRHIESNHITGVIHACDICGKVSRSRNAFRQHMSKVHETINYWFSGQGTFTVGMPGSTEGLVDTDL